MRAIWLHLYLDVMDSAMTLFINNVKEKLKKIQSTYVARWAPDILAATQLLDFFQHVSWTGMSNKVATQVPTSYK